MDKYIRLFSSLGERLYGFGSEAVSQGAVTAAVKANRWFTPADIMMAVEAIRSSMLQPNILAGWLERYDIKRSSVKDVAVIMAGNIPFVGFSDLLAVVAAGDACHIKMSSKDTVLMEYVIGLLKETDRSVPISAYREGGHYDAVIATGSDNTNRYFRSAFSGIPSLLRGSRSSVAVLGGEEPESLLRQLSVDIFSYSGLGCRSTSFIFVPEGYDVRMLGAKIAPDAGDMNQGYLDNYTRNKALLSVSGETFSDFGTFLMQERSAFPVSISSVNYCRYDRLDKVERWLEANDDGIQCVVTGPVRHARAADFGRAHYPRPWDYPDGKDVIEFLNDLK